MGKYSEASKMYKEAMNNWKQFVAQKNVSYSFNNFIHLCKLIAQLDLPDPFEEKAKEEIAKPDTIVEEKVEEPAAETTKPEVAQENTEDGKPGGQFNKHQKYNGKRW